MSGILKERRESLGRDISEIAQVTRIKGSYLRSIEEEDYGKLPVEVYTRGYIKEYAEFLGIPADAALGPYEKYLEAKKASKGKEPVEKSSPFISAKDSHDDLELIRKIIANESEETSVPLDEEPRKNILSGRIIWVFLLVTAAVGIYALIPRQESAPPVPPVPPAVQEQAKAPETQPAPPAPGTPEEQAAKGQAETKGLDNAPAMKGPAAGGAEKTPAKGAEQREVAVQPKKKHSLDITATGRTWVQMIIDGSERREMTLNPGEKANVGADKHIVLKIGNAAGVALRYDGKEMRNLGEEGEVVTLNFPAAKPSQPAPPKEQDSGENASDQPEPTEQRSSEPSKQ